MTAEDLVPLLLVVAAMLLLPRGLFGRRWFEKLVVAGLAVLILRYLHWRLFVTVLPADPLSVEGLVVWTIFAVEVLTWADAGILFAFLIARTDRSAEADAHERRLRASSPDALPEVDVFIATYDEPPEVLEKTISGAINLDWPKARLNIWVLDDGRRDWLKAMAAQRRVGYLTRADNRGAKAGNINAAIQATRAPFFLVLDADFIPQRNFLFRAMGFFADPRIGIVQIPHNFFNADPMQVSLNMSKVMPDDQRFFFEAIMPGRDGYDCAFCCGSNGIVRRAALERIGNALPTGSITEDMLLTIALMREGYVTRYLNEKLAFGLAPESINAFFVQRSRWARGGIQIMFLKSGPLGAPGLALHERLFFLPLHWLTQSLGQSIAMATPAFFLLTGIPPLLGTTTGDILSIQIPAIVATVAAVRLFAPGQYHPLASTAHGVLQAFRLLPVVLATLVKPHGHAFKVTPKGLRGGSVADPFTLTVVLGLAGLTGAGLLLNAYPGTQIIPFSHLVPVVTFWSILNMVVLLLVAKIAVTPPVRRSEERFAIEEPARVRLERFSAEVGLRDVSLNGAAFVCDGPLGLDRGDWLGLEIADVGLLPARVARLSGDGRHLGVAFALPSLMDQVRRNTDLRARRRIDGDVSATLDLGERTLTVKLNDISPTGAGVLLPPETTLRAGSWAVFALDNGTSVPAQIKYVRPDPEDGTLRAGLEFHILDSDLRERLLRKLFTEGRSQSHTTTRDGGRIFWSMLRQIFQSDPPELPGATAVPPQALVVPNWLQDQILEDAAGTQGTAGAENPEHDRGAA